MDRHLPGYLLEGSTGRLQGQLSAEVILQEKECRRDQSHHDNEISQDIGTNRDEPAKYPAHFTSSYLFENKMSTPHNENQRSFTLINSSVTEERLHRSKVLW